MGGCFKDFYLNYLNPQRAFIDKSLLEGPLRALLSLSIALRPANILRPFPFELSPPSQRELFVILDGPWAQDSIQRGILTFYTDFTQRVFSG